MCFSIVNFFDSIQLPSMGLKGETVKKREIRTRPAQNKFGGRKNRPPKARGRGEKYHYQGNRIGHRKIQPNTLTAAEK